MHFLIFCSGERADKGKFSVILSVSEGSRVATHGVLFTGFFVAALLRMTAIFNKRRRKNPSVILSVSEGSRMLTL